MLVVALALLFASGSARGQTSSKLASNSGQATDSCRTFLEESIHGFSRGGSALRPARVDLQPGTTVPT